MNNNKWTIERSLVAWVIILFGLTGLGVLAFTIAGTDPSDVAPSSPLFIASVCFGLPGTSGRLLLPEGRGT
jgi:hypothetical protein